jgi:hypothetical protein
MEILSPSFLIVQVSSMIKKKKMKHREQKNKNLKPYGAKRYLTQKLNPNLLKN